MTDIPLSKKLNPIWWFGNDSEQTVEQAPWYHGPDPTVDGWEGPTWPEWKRKLYWGFRNPLQNFRAFVIGVQDKEHETRVISGNPDPTVIQRDDVGETGWQITTLKLKDSGIVLPFVSYSGSWVFQFGWQPSSGFFGLKLHPK